MNYFNFNVILYDDDEFATEFKGVNRYPFSYRADDIALYEILPTQQFRSDKICYELYGDPSLGWVLDDINNFKHGVKEYLPGKKIKYVKRAILVQSGLLS